MGLLDRPAAQSKHDQTLEGVLARLQKLLPQRMAAAGQPCSPCCDLAPLLTCRSCAAPAWLAGAASQP